MKKLGFGKKGEGSEDSNRSALFGSRSKNKSSNPSENPYAQQLAAADPYQQAKRAAVAGDHARGQSPSNAGPFNTGPGRGGYGGMNGNMGGGSDGGNSQIGGKSSGAGGYGSEKYGAQSGYGGDRYGGAAGATGGSRYGAGGYGGMGEVEDHDTKTDDNRSALFGGAKERVQQSQKPGGQGQPPPYEEHVGESSSGGNQGYEAYGDRQLTAEEEEEEEVEGTKQEIRFMKREDVSSTRNALRIAAQAEDTGRNTLARLGAQGERIHNTEKNLDLTANHNRIAEEKARQLKTLNKSMFAVHVANPFTSSSRARQRDEDVLDKHHEERAEREATRREGYNSEKRLQKTFKDLQPGDAGYAKAQQSSLAERAKYQFEADSEDEDMEKEIDSNLDALSGAASRLNGLARATGKEVDEQNRHLERINAKSTKVDDQIAMNRARLDRFNK